MGFAELVALIFILAIGFVVYLWARRVARSKAKNSQSGSPVQKRADLCYYCGAPMSERAAFCQKCGKQRFAKDIRDVLLRQTDVPRGFLPPEVEARGNVAAARLSKDPDSELKLLEQGGRIIGYRAFFGKSEATPEEAFILSEVVLHRDASEAAFLTKDWKACIHLPEIHELRVLSMDELAVPQIGESSFMCRLALSVKEGEYTTKASMLFVFWRRSNVVSGVAWLWSSGAKGVFQEEVLSLCHKQDLRVASFLRDYELGR